MTHDELNAMTDRELDALVQWHIVQGGKSLTVREMLTAYRPHAYQVGHEKKLFVTDGVPHYSTDMNAARLVVEKMRPGYRLWLSGGGPVYLWEASVTKCGTYDESYSSHANPARAICIAALLAMGVSAS